MLLKTLFNAIKKQHPNNLIGFQLGHMCVFLEQDAQKIQQMYGVTVREFVDNDKNSFVKMAGIPIESAEKTPEVMILKEGN